MGDSGAQDAFGKKSRPDPRDKGDSPGTNGLPKKIAAGGIFAYDALEPERVPGV
jgi:hypothetical protein